MKLGSLAVALVLLPVISVEAESPASAKPLEHITLKLSDTAAMKLVKVPAGKFLMGSKTTERHRTRDGRESPRREVTITRDFHIGICEVTRGQFAAFVKDSGYITQAEREGWTFAWDGRVWGKVNGASWRKAGFDQTDEHPVICVSFDDAVAFCRWMGKKTAKHVLLPTEAQWAYACRAGTKTAYVWGDKWDDGKGWANAADATARKRFKGWRAFPWADGYVFTSPAGKYKANAFGLHDVHGNVFEWCADWYDKDYFKKGPKVDPMGPAGGRQRVLRGGSWLSSPGRCRSAGRTGCNLRGSYCDFIVGFRVVVEPDDSRKLPGESRPNRPDWPDWRGPRRDGVSRHVPAKLPAKVRFAWTQKTTGPGLSGLTVANGRVIVADKSADAKHDIWRCLDADTGKEIWRLKYAAEGKMPYTNSPRAAPVVHDGKTYLMGAFGDLHCVASDTGKVLWKKQLIKDFGADLPKWGMTATPLLVDDKLIVNPGAEDASVVALDRKSGKVLWKSPGSAAAYAAFIFTNFGGRRQAVGYDTHSLGGWDVNTGKRMWQLVAPEKGDFNVPTPIAIADRLLVATENNGVRLYGFTGNGAKIRPKPQRQFNDLAPDMVSPVVYGGMVFGSHNAHLYCLDANSLKVLWKARDDAYYGFTTLIAGNGRVMIVTIDGELLLVAADKSKYKLISRLKVFTGEGTEVWSHPALVPGRLYIRSKNTVACMKLK